MYRSHYRILGLIGQGQFGRVFCAVNRKTGEIVALKDLELSRFPTNKFLRELSYLLTLRHPNIVSCTGLEYNQAGRYVVMDYYEGGTLRDLMNSQAQVNLEQKLNLVEDILSGLAHAHSRQIVHCDVKPENILLKVKPSSWSAHISDFGIARLIQEINPQIGGYTGSPAYMAPERFYGKHSFASDLYAVGIILFELLTGYRPFSGYPGELMTAHMSQTVNIPDTIPPVLSSIVEIALRKLPQRRFKSTQEMLTTVRLASKKLGMNSDSSNLFLSSSFVTTSTTVKTIHHIPLPQRVTHLAVCNQYLYLGMEDKLCCQYYPDSSFVSKPVSQWQINLEGTLVQLDSHSQGCLTVTRLLNDKEVKISYFHKDNNSNQVCLLNLDNISPVAPRGNWLAFTTSQTNLHILKIPSLDWIKTSIPCSSSSQLIPVDSRHGLVIESGLENETTFKLFTRRGNLLETFSLSLVLNSVTSNPYLPYSLFAIESKELGLAILINLKPLKITRIPLTFNPAFILGKQWGFLIASRQGQVWLLNERGVSLGCFEVEEGINAIAFWDEFRLLIATQVNQQEMLDVIDLENMLSKAITLKNDLTTSSSSRP